MSLQEHKKTALKSVRCKVITVSDTRDKDNDKSGKLIIELLENAGHAISDYVIVKDEKDPIKEAVLKGCWNPDVDVVSYKWWNGYCS